MRLSYHGWAALLLVLSFALAAGGIALGIAPVSVDNIDGTTTTCGSPWAPSVGLLVGAQCAAGFGARGLLGGLLAVSGVTLFLGMLVAGMIVAGVRDALVNSRQAPDTAPAAGERPA